MTASRAKSIGPARFNTAVHALIGLAHNGGTVSSSVIAQQVQSHATFLRRILSTLAHHGIVEAREGRDGGYSLKIPADTLTLADIYSAIRSEEHTQLESSTCTSLAQLLNQILSEAEQEAIQHLKKYTLSDLLYDLNLQKSIQKIHG